MRTVRLGGLQWGKVFGGGVQAEKGIRWREVVGCCICKYFTLVITFVVQYSSMYYIDRVVQ